nr:unnamed protein product [Callosobruchus chinensis]
MEEYVQDMGDEDPVAVDSDDDPEYVQEGEGKESGQQVPRKRQKTGASTSKTRNDSSSSSSSSSNIEDIDILDADGWGHVDRNFKDFVFDVSFGAPANTVNELRGCNDLGCFSQIVTEEVFGLMVKQTNIYADQKIVKQIVDESIGPKSRLNDWATTNSADMKVFLGIIIWMELNRKPTLKDYWSWSVKWYRKIAVEVLTGTALVNACHLCKVVNNSSIHITTFRENLCRLLLKSDEQPIPGEDNADHKMQPSEKRV